MATSRDLCGFVGLNISTIGRKINQSLTQEKARKQRKILRLLGKDALLPQQFSEYIDK